MTKTGDPDVVGVLLAGGLSRRFGGGDKALRKIDERTVLEYVVARMAGQVGAMILNAAGDGSRFPDFGADIVPDVVPGALGPLAGVLTGMMWARDHAPGSDWIATVPTDAPFVPTDLVARLKAAVQEAGADIALARSGGRVHPVFAVWRAGLLDDLHHALVDEGQRKVMTWVERHAWVAVDFATDPVDPFFNINTPEDLEHARVLAPKTLPDEG